MYTLSIYRGTSIIRPIQIDTNIKANIKIRTNRITIAIDGTDNQNIAQNGHAPHNSMKMSHFKHLISVYVKY